MNRRSLMSGAFFLAFARNAHATAEMVEIETFDSNGRSLGLSRLEKIVKTDAEWRAQLWPLAFEVTRKDGTERAFTGPDWDNHADGLYRCVCCDTALFDSKTKYDSGTGWPSFFAPISKARANEHETAGADREPSQPSLKRRLSGLCAEGACRRRNGRG